MNTPASDSDKERWLGYLSATVTSITWGLQAIALKFAIHSIPLITVVWFRLTFAFVFLVLFLKHQAPESLKILKSPPLGTIIAAFFLAINYHTFLLGLDMTSPSAAQVMIQSGPYGLAIFSFFYFKERLTKISFAGFLLVPFGMYLFFRDEFGTGNIWVLVSGIAWAIYSIYQKLLTKNLHPNQILLVVFAATSLFFLPIGHPTNLISWGAREWTIMTVLGLFTVIGYCGLGLALAKAPASQVSIIISCNPLITIFLMQGLAKIHLAPVTESIRSLGYIGALLVALGVSLALSSGAKTTK
ncbi:MAG: hypothetical protein A4S09_12240 [Proteobacteria bacterium SG_bin7]|nr:MAG: hypothetical protein A4S09_12240 [Proteobacteria bacterium SG_bin7]